MRQIERGFGAVLFFLRWLIAPFLIGLLCALLLLIYRFFADLYEIFSTLPSLKWHDLLVDVLYLVDISLTANLVLIVVFSGFENFIHAGEHDRELVWPAGLKEVDFGALKHKLLGSITVIAAVDALAWYLDLEKTTDTVKLGWAIAFPVMFVASLLMLAAADRLARHGDK